MSHSKHRLSTVLTTCKENKVEYIHSQCERPPQSCTQCISMFPPKLSMEAQLESNKCYLGNLVVVLELQCTGMECAGMVGSWYDVNC